MRPMYHRRWIRSSSSSSSSTLLGARDLDALRFGKKHVRTIHGIGRVNPDALDFEFCRDGVLFLPQLLLLRIVAACGVQQVDGDVNGILYLGVLSVGLLLEKCEARDDLLCGGLGGAKRLRWLHHEAQHEILALLGHELAPAQARLR